MLTDFREQLLNLLGCGFGCGDGFSIGGDGGLGAAAGATARDA